MSTYDTIAWLPLCGGLTGVGLILSFLVARRRGAGAGLRGAAWSLLPLAAYLTGSIEMFWKMGVAVGDFAKGFAFSPRVWSGIALAGAALFLFLVSGGLRRRRGGRAGRRERSRAAAEAPGARTAVTAAHGPQPGRAQAPARAPAKVRKSGPNDDDDLGEVADILRRHGIT